MLDSEASWAERLQGALGSLERHAAIERSVIYSLNARSRQLEIVARHGLAARHYRPRLGSGVAGRAAHSEQRHAVLDRIPGLAAFAADPVGADGNGPAAFRAGQQAFD